MTKTTMTTTYHIDIDALTVLATGADGESHDLNAAGEPCENQLELADFITELAEQGAYGEDVRDALLGELIGEAV